MSSVPSKYSETSENSSYWEVLIAKLLDSSKIEKNLAHFQMRNGIFGTVTFLGGYPVNVSFLEKTDREGSVRISVFLNDSEEVESIVRTAHATRSFSNGIHRDSHHRSLISELTFRQSFSPAGTPNVFPEHALNAIAELHVHTRTFIWKNSRETANSFLGYWLDGAGVCKSQDRTADKTFHFPIPGWISIHEHKVDSNNSALNVSSNPDTLLELEESASKGLLPYEVRMRESHVEVLMANAPIGEFRIFDTFGFAEIETVLFWTESSRAFENTVESVSRVLHSASK